MLQQESDRGADRYQVIARMFDPGTADGNHTFDDPAPVRQQFPDLGQGADIEYADSDRGGETAGWYATPEY